MNEEIRKRFPEWCGDDESDYKLCLSNDIDSLFSCIALNKIKKYEIKYFYDFKGLYKCEGVNKKLNLIGVDMDLTEGRCWGNHVTTSKNNKSANLNTICNIKTNNYFDKYAGNTILTILSYYNIPITAFTEEQQMVLLSIDAMVKGFYNNRFRPIQKHYLSDVLEYPELTEMIDKHILDDFYNIADKYKLYGKIWANSDGYLQTDINFSGLSELFGMSFFIPQNKFIKKKTYRDTGISLQEFSCINKDNIFSCALTNRTFYKCSIAV